MNDALSSWPGLVVGHPLVERPADALRDAAVDLALDDHRVDQVAAVVDDGVLQDRDLGGRRGRSRRSRRACRRRTSSARGSRSRVPSSPGSSSSAHRRLARVADGELGGRLGRLVEGVAQRVGQHRDGAEVDRRCRVPRTETTPSTISRSSGRRLERVGRDPQRLLAGPRRRQVDRPSRSSPRRARRTCPRRTASGGCRR